MPSKAFQISVELNIHTITCPGVWLCPNSGKVALCVFMLDSCGQTSLLEPVFPLLFHERFQFNNTIYNARSLKDLQEVLCNEFLYCELVQWSSANGCQGKVLSNFQTSLATLLYPEVTDKTMLAGVDVELLMEACKCFPGIIAPKIEVSTKTTIKEIANKCQKNRCGCPTYIISPKTIASNKFCRRRPRTMKHQKTVCHTNLLRKFANQSPYKLSSISIAPHIVEYQSKCKPRRLAQDMGRKRYNHIPLWKRNRHNTREKVSEVEPYLCECIKTSCPSSLPENSTNLAKKCVCHLKCKDSCPVCIKYQEYFRETKKCSTPQENYCNTEKDFESSYVRSAEKLHRKIKKVLQESATSCNPDCMCTHKKNNKRCKSPKNYSTSSCYGNTSPTSSNGESFGGTHCEKCVNSNKSKGPIDCQEAKRRLYQVTSDSCRDIKSPSINNELNYKHQKSNEKQTSNQLTNKNCTAQNYKNVSCEISQVANTEICKVGCTCRKCFAKLCSSKSGSQNSRTCKVGCTCRKCLNQKSESDTVVDGSHQTKPCLPSNRVRRPLSSKVLFDKSLTCFNKLNENSSPISQLKSRSRLEINKSQFDNGQPCFSTREPTITENISQCIPNCNCPKSSRNQSREFSSSENKRPCIPCCKCPKSSYRSISQSNELSSSENKHPCTPVCIFPRSSNQSRSQSRERNSCEYKRPCTPNCKCSKSFNQACRPSRELNSTENKRPCTPNCTCPKSSNQSRSPIKEFNSSENRRPCTFKCKCTKSSNQPCPPSRERSCYENKRPCTPNCKCSKSSNQSCSPTRKGNSYENKHSCASNCKCTKSSNQSCSPSRERSNHENKRPCTPVCKYSRPSNQSPSQSRERTVSENIHRCKSICKCEKASNQSPSQSKKFSSSNQNCICCKCPQSSKTREKQISPSRKSPISGINLSIKRNKSCDETMSVRPNSIQTTEFYKNSNINNLTSPSNSLKSKYVHFGGDRFLCTPNNDTVLNEHYYDVCETNSNILDADQLYGKKSSVCKCFEDGKISENYRSLFYTNLSNFYDKLYQRTCYRAAQERLLP